MSTEELLDAELFATDLRRRDLLPTWIKVFVWIFLIFSVLAIISLIAGGLGYVFNIELYGLKTTDALSPIGILILVLYMFKGVVAYGLWTEKDWAVRLAITDAIIGIIICAFSMFVLPFLEMTDDHFRVTFRLDIIALIPYLIKMRNIRDDWDDIGRGIKN